MSHLTRRVRRLQLFANTNILKEGRGNAILYTKFPYIQKVLNILSNTPRLEPVATTKSFADKV